MPPLGVVDGVQQGSVEMCHTVPYYYFGKNEAFAIGAAIPSGMNSRQMTSWMMHGNGQAHERVLRQVQHRELRWRQHRRPDGGLVPQGDQDPGRHQGPEVPHRWFAGRVIERMGGVPQNIPGGEIYQALEKGTIDAAEWVGPYDDQKLGFNKVAPYYYYPGWWEGGPEVDFFINNKALDALSAENKAIIEAASAYAHVDMQAKYDALN